ncbi:SNARE domain-containing protein [Cordyceps javanica]|uniref:SNARE domain-containing protein n=1 Tax=Cordyceps javanica TaxID=43265 RepID=A0A545ULV5_9HYPO|nr:SNARE domain-containing protein [Cordyceps javanica]
MASRSSVPEYIPPRVAWDDMERGYDSTMDSNDHRLLRVISLGQGREPATWGITVVRTDYRAPRRQLLNALACINGAVQADLGAKRPYARRRDGLQLDDLRTTMTMLPVEQWPSTAARRGALRPGDELFARYTTELLSTYDGLNEAQTDAVRSKFQSWIAQTHGNTQGGDMRHVFCVILDADTIRQLDDVWCRGSRVGGQERIQVSVLDAVVPGGGSGGDAYRIHLRGRHGLVNFWFARSVRQQPLEVMLARTLRRGGDGVEDRFGGLHQRDSRSALFEGYSGGGGDPNRRGGGSPAGGYGYHSSSNTGSPSPYNSYSAYGNPNMGPGAAAGPAYRSATPNQKGQYSDAVLNELESQNDAQVAGILGKVRTLKDMTVAIGDEIRDSSALAEKMNDTFDQTRLRLRGTMNRMLLMAQRSGIPWKVWLLFFLAVILIFTYVWLF